MCEVKSHSTNLFSEFKSNITLSNMANDFIKENRTFPFRIENFSYKNEIVMDTLFRHLENTDFHGVSVRSSTVRLVTQS